MKNADNVKIPSLIFAAAVVASFGFVFPASAQQNFPVPYIVDLNTRQVTSLGTLGGVYSDPSAINDSGQVTGFSYTAANDLRAFITGPNGVGMTDLGTLGGIFSYASGINASGQVAGTSLLPGTGNNSHAFITGPNGRGMTNIGPFEEYTLSHAYDINNTGQVVGDLSGSDSIFYAFITGPNGMGMRSLGGQYSTGFGINDAGQVVGNDYATGPSRAFITGPNGTDMRDLGTLGGIFSLASDINNVGQAVGSSTTNVTDFDPYHDGHAFITGPNGTDMRDLGTLGGNYSEAFAINNAGQVVGRSAMGHPDYPGGPDIEHAFITGPNGAGMMDLNLLVDPPEGIILTDARDINNNGQVIAVGMVPEPESYALLLTGLALIGFVARRKKMSEAALARGRRLGVKINFCHAATVRVLPSAPRGARAFS